MNEHWDEERKWMVDAGIITFTRLATFVDGPYEGQERDVEYYFKRISVTSMDRGTDNPIAVKIGEYELIEGTNGQYKWKGWR